jgi:hypothetical protein
MGNTNLFDMRLTHACEVKHRLKQPNEQMAHQEACLTSIHAGLKRDEHLFLAHRRKMKLTMLDTSFSSLNLRKA